MANKSKYRVRIVVLNLIDLGSTKLIQLDLVQANLMPISELT